MKNDNNVVYVYLKKKVGCRICVFDAPAMDSRLSIILIHASKGVVPNLPKTLY